MVQGLTEYVLLQPPVNDLGFAKDPEGLKKVFERSLPATDQDQVSGNVLSQQNCLGEYLPRQSFSSPHYYVHLRLLQVAVFVSCTGLKSGRLLEKTYAKVHTRTLSFRIRPPPQHTWRNWFDSCRVMPP